MNDPVTVPVGEILACLGAILALIGFIMAGVASRRLTLARRMFEREMTRLTYNTLPPGATMDPMAVALPPYRHAVEPSPQLDPLLDPDKPDIKYHAGHRPGGSVGWPKS